MGIKLPRKHLKNSMCSTVNETRVDDYLSRNLIDVVAAHGMANRALPVIIEQKPDILTKSRTQAPNTINVQSLVSVSVIVQNTVVDYIAGAQSFFGSPIPALNTLHVPIVLSDPLDGCSKLKGKTYNHQMALVRRGGCPFIKKAHNLGAAGALGMIVFDHEDSELLFNMKADESMTDV